MTLQSASFLVFHQGTANLIALVLNLLQSHLQFLIPLVVFLSLLYVLRRLVVRWLQDIMETVCVFTLIWFADELGQLQVGVFTCHIVLSRFRIIATLDR